MDRDNKQKYRRYQKILLTENSAALKKKRKYDRERQSNLRKRKSVAVLADDQNCPLALRKDIHHIKLVRLLEK